MKKAIIDLNCKDRDYKFSLSVITENDWVAFAHAIVLNKGENVKDLQLNGFKVVVRDNKAKIKVYYQDTCYHELEYHLDEFGRVSKHYEDVISLLFQSVMQNYYGKEYCLEFERKLKSLDTTL